MMVRPVVPHDLRGYRAPFRLRDHFRVRDLVWLGIVAAIIGWSL